MLAQNHVFSMLPHSTAKHGFVVTQKTNNKTKNI